MVCQSQQDGRVCLPGLRHGKAGLLWLMGCSPAGAGATGRRLPSWRHCSGRHRCAARPLACRRLFRAAGCAALGGAPHALQGVLPGRALREGLRRRLPCAAVALPCPQRPPHVRVRCAHLHAGLCTKAVLCYLASNLSTRHPSYWQAALSGCSLGVTACRADA